MNVIGLISGDSPWVSPSPGGRDAVLARVHEEEGAGAVRALGVTNTEAPCPRIHNIKGETYEQRVMRAKQKKHSAG